MAASPRRPGFTTAHGSPRVNGGPTPVWVPSYARLKRVNVRTYDTGVVFLHYEPQREV